MGPKVPSSLMSKASRQFAAQNPNIKALPLTKAGSTTLSHTGRLLPNFMTAREIKSVFRNNPLRLTWTSDSTTDTGSFPEQIGVIFESSGGSWSISQYQASCGSLGATRAGQAFSVVLTRLQAEVIVGGGESFNVSLFTVGSIPSGNNVIYNCTLESL